MSKYSKFVGAIVGGVIGLIMAAVGLADAAGVPAAYQPMVDAVTTMVTSALGTYIAPPNATE